MSEPTMPQGAANHLRSREFGELRDCLLRYRRFRSRSVDDLRRRRPERSRDCGQRSQRNVVGDLVGIRLDVVVPRLV